MSEKKYIILNDKQAMFMQAIQTKKLEIAGLVAGRGFGKSFVMGIITGMIVHELPRAKGGIGGITIKQIKTVTLPVIKDVWKSVFQFREYNKDLKSGDYIMFKEPPKHWARPYMEPEDWGNVIAFKNGTCFELEGFKMTALENRGKNHDFYMVDEFAFFKEDWVKIFSSTLRANVGKYTSTMHHTFFFFTSPPLIKSGMHVWKYRDEAKKYPDKVLFMHGKTRDNLQNLPKNFIEIQKKILTKFEYDVEIEGKEIAKTDSLYYPSLTDKNLYTDHLLLDESDLEDDWYSPSRHLIASLDFNAKFTCATLYQEIGSTSRCVDNVFVHNAEPNKTMSQTLGIEIAKLYEYHDAKHITLVGDRNGASKSAGSNTTMFEQVKQELEGAGWSVSVQASTYNPLHKDKYIMVNDVLSESGVYPFKLRFHSTRCRSTIVSMENAPVEADYKKNKDSEKSGDQELATHLSDTVDYYVIWRIKGGRNLDDESDILML